MALSLTLDFGIRFMNEPGYHKYTSSRDLTDGLNPKDDAAHKGIWWDEPTGTLMLRPLQVDADWLDSPQQVDSIIRLDDLIVSAADQGAQRVHESAVFNNANPWIWHVPVGPATGFPTAPPPSGRAVPGTFLNSLTGVTSTADLTDILTFNAFKHDWYEPPLSIPPSGPYTPTAAGGFGDGKYPARTKARLPANQPFLFRWFHPEDRTGFKPIYILRVGQYALHIRDVVVQIYQDISAGGDRTSWRKIHQAPLFGRASSANAGPGHPFVEPRLADIQSRDRASMWLPYRRHQIALFSSANEWTVLTTRPFPVRNADNTDWDITREDTVEVWTMTNAYGRFQIQKIKYATGPVTFQAPTITIPYAPTPTPTQSFAKDEDHGTSISETLATPASYALPSRPGETCPPVVMDPSSGLSRTYGLELTLNGESTHRWTPFFYGVTTRVTPVFVDYPKTPAAVGDTGLTTSHITSVEFSHGFHANEGQAQFEVMDFDPFPLAGFYYRPSFPVRLADGSTKLFTGYTAPPEVTPLRFQTTTPRRIVFSAKDRYQQLQDAFLTDRRDWLGTGHITVVDTLLQYAGYDTTALPPEYPPLDTPAHIAANNTALGGVDITISELSGDHKPGWSPTFEDTAATFIERIAKLFSGWEFGFYPDGQFFYRPRDFFTASEVTFYESEAARAAAAAPTAPLYRNPVTFTTIEPEANVIQVLAGNAQEATYQLSPLYVDWASIRNPDKLNYLGRWRAEVIQVAGVFSCSQLDWMARRAWEFTRRRYVNVRFEADFVPTLKIGHCFTLDGYGLYRLQSYSCRWERHGWHPATYQGELVETGN